MGTIQQQSIRNAAVSYVGVFIGFFSTLFIYKLDRELYGFAQFIFTSASFLIPFCTLGITGLVVKFFPLLTQRGFSASAYVNLNLRLLVTAYLLFIVVFFFASDHIFRAMGIMGLDKNNILQDNWKYFLPLALLMGTASVLIAHSSNMRRIVVPELLSSFAYKLCLPILILLGFHGHLSKDQVAIGQNIFYLFVVVAMLIYLYQIDGLGKTSGKRISIAPTLRRDMTSFAGYNMLTNLGTAFLFRIDIILLSLLLNFGSAGTYVIMLFLANSINIPRRALSKIIAPFISQAWNDQDDAKIQELYKRTSVILLIFGIALFLMIWSSLQDLDKLSPGDKMFYQHRFVFLFLGIGKLLDLSMSLTTEIIIYSKKYRYILVFLLIMGSVAFGLNYLLIPSLGILGAAIAVSISYGLYNIFKTTLVFTSFGMIPFSYNTWILLGMGGTMFLLLTWLEIESFHPIINLIFKSSIIFFGFLAPVYLLNISTDYNRIIDGIIGKIKLKIPH